MMKEIIVLLMLLCATWTLTEAVGQELNQQPIVVRVRSNSPIEMNVRVVEEDSSGIKETLPVVVYQEQQPQIIPVNVVEQPQIIPVNVVEQPQVIPVNIVERPTLVQQNQQIGVQPLSTPCLPNPEEVAQALFEKYKKDAIAANEIAQQANRKVHRENPCEQDADVEASSKEVVNDTSTQAEAARNKAACDRIIMEFQLQQQRQNQQFNQMLMQQMMNQQPMDFAPMPSFTPSSRTSYKRTCTIHNIEYTLPGSCPRCSAPQFGLRSALDDIVEEIH